MKRWCLFVLILITFSLFFLYPPQVKASTVITGVSCDVTDTTCTCAGSGGCNPAYSDSDDCVNTYCASSCPSLPQASVSSNGCGIWDFTYSGCYCADAWCTGGTCSCVNAGGTCNYNCDSGWFDDNGISDDGCENQAPYWYTPSVNNTNPATGEVVSHNINWTDVTGAAGSGLGVNFTMLEVNGTEASCDTWDNVSTVARNNINSTWSNMTWTIPAACAGKTIGWRQYANDSANRWNVTGIQTYTVAPAPKIAHANGITLYYYTGERVNGNVTVIPVENPDNKTNPTAFTNGEWSVDFDMSTDDVLYLTFIIDDNKNIGYNQLKLDNANPNTATLNCTTQNISLSGYSVDVDTGNSITSGNVKVSALDTDYTNTTSFTGTWSIDFFPCLVSGKIYILQILVSDNTGKRGEILQKYPAR